MYQVNICKLLTGLLHVYDKSDVNGVMSLLMSDMNETVLVLLCLGQAADEVKLLARFRSGHTRDQRHVTGLKVYPTCPNSNVTQATPAHILACIGCHNSQQLSSH
ncbi:hypothetical protein TNCV_4757641 [Trichonephila clavipes]|nr:hypothetical protein TNCV_4757641 [Trichonephila clavipes]